MGPVEARERLLAELPNSAVFGAQFRMNAARALMLPAAKGTQKRTPFWLQRLRAKDLLSVAKGFEDFPIILETYRDCLRDVLDLVHLEEVLDGLSHGEIELITAETIAPSPVAAGLLYDFVNQYMYEWDQPKAERQMGALMMGRELLAQLLDEASLPELLRPEAVRAVDDRLQYRADGTRARTAEELATVFLALGDLSPEEAATRSDGDGTVWVEDLAGAGRLVALDLGTGRRHVLSEQVEVYRTAFDLGDRSSPAESQDEARRSILRRVLSTHGPLTKTWLLTRYRWEADWLEAALAALVESGEVVAGQITPGTRSPATEPVEIEYCDRRNLERIHRQTLALLRKEVEPVSVYAYADFLTRWQHLHPSQRLSEPGALVQLLQQLRGVPAPGAVWERDLLSLRLPSFDGQELQGLCRQGDLVWVGSGSKDPRRARIRFLFRGEGHLFLPSEPETTDLSPEAQTILAFLKSEGACFFADLETGTDLGANALTAALAELMMGGLVTNDSLQTLRGLLAWSPEEEGAARKPLSSLDAELSAWRRARTTAPPIGQRPSRARLRRAQRAVSQRLEPPSTTREWPGRWGLVHRIGVWGKDVDYATRIARQARQLLQCYGIVTRQSLKSWEAGLEERELDWGALYRQFQLMEMRGEARRGYFVQGLPGIQFALPEAVERLRDWSHPPAPDAGPISSEMTGELVLLNACDPANLFGPSLPGADASEPDPARFSRIPSNYVVLLHGRPVLLLETGGERLTSLPDLPPQTLKRALRLALDHIGPALGRLTVSEWNGAPVVDSTVAPLLEEIGFRREALVYIGEG
jgi:ATP-dependent Lhr-like helicase